MKRRIEYSVMYIPTWRPSGIEQNPYDCYFVTEERLTDFVFFNRRLIEEEIRSRNRFWMRVHIYTDLELQDELDDWKASVVELASGHAVEEALK